MIPNGLGEAGDAFTLPFLDLHYFQNGVGAGANSSTGSAGGGSLGAAETAVHGDSRKGAALDLARAVPAVQTKVGDGAPMPRERIHQRGMSAVSPQDLLLNKGGCGDNKRKRASWDGRSR